MKIRLLALVLAGGCAMHMPGPGLAAEKADVAQKGGTKRDTKMQWWRDAQYGMFIHWGVYAEYAGYYKGKKGWIYSEHIMQRSKIPVKEYEKTAATFNPVNFDAKEWVRIAEAAGMRYIVITAKHHDGFCMYDSDHTTYDIVDWTPFKRDPIKELAEACKGSKVRFCIYYSHMDWHYTHKSKGYDEYRMKQVAELIDKYDPGVLWFDDYGHTGPKSLLTMLSENYPNLIVNERVTQRGKGAGDFKCSEQHIPERGSANDWETCMTLNDSWGYHKGDNKWKSAATLIHKMIDVTSKGGNFLLNVGPDNKGVIPAPSVERLKEVGEWMKVHGEAIYGTSLASVPSTETVKFTAKPGKLFAHILKWPEEKTMTVTTAKRRVAKAYVLADEQQLPLRTEVDGENVVVHLPPNSPNPIASVIVIEYAENKPDADDGK